MTIRRTSVLLWSLALLGCDTAPAPERTPASAPRAAKREPAPVPPAVRPTVESLPETEVPRVDPAPDPGSPLAGAELVVLGSGTPVPDPERAGPSLAVVVGERAYLVDAGAGVVRRAAAAASAGIAALEPTRLAVAFITHLHSDHTVGLPDLWLTPAVAGRREPLRLFGPPGLSAMADKLEAAYAEDLAARGALRGVELGGGYRLSARELVPGPVALDGPVKVRAFAVPHGVWKHAFGYRFDAAGRSFVISGDTAPSDAIVEACAGCDVLAHEVYCHASVAGGPPDFRAYHGSHHTSSLELAQLAERARPRLLLLYHALFFGCSPEALLAEVREHYDGRVELARDLGRY